MKLIFTAIITFCTSVYAVEEVKPELQKIGDLITYFYTDKNVEKLKIIDVGITNLAEELSKSNFGQMAAIGLALASKEMKYNVIGTTKIHENSKLLMTDRWEKLQKYINDESNVDPGKLDIWWISFFMTGDEKYLQYLINTSTIEIKEDEVNLAISAARWSLKANCKQHKTVLEYVTKVNLKANNDFLRECIEYGKK